MRACTAILYLLVTTSCVVGREDAGVATDPEPLPGGPSPARFGVVMSPRHGDIIVEPTSRAVIEVSGFGIAPGQRIDVQVLADPQLPTSWTTIGSTVTEATATDDNLFAWATIVQPTRESPRRWPEGGILRLRAIDDDGDLLAVLLHDGDDCLGAIADEPLPSGVARCAAPVTNGLVLVSPSPTPADLPTRARFLDRRGAVDAGETAEYYAATNAPPTLAEFRARFGFDATSQPAVFYNAGDLGIGREMHCRAQPDGGAACYVSNYGEFGGDVTTAIARAIEGVQAGGSRGSFATVAMVYSPPITAPNSVRFVVYDAAGALASQAQLDTFGDNMSIPNNCLNCHGGARYNATRNEVIGARFLPFDPAAFGFAPTPGFRAEDQLPRILGFNQLVAATEPTPAIAELIEGFGASPSPIPADPDFVPAGWSNNTLERAVYTEAVAVACRSCHTSLAGPADFASAESFRSFSAAIAGSLCGPSGRPDSHDMPSAEVPMRRLWTTSARAYLVDYLDIPGACEP